jgi:hypothetical protein
VVKYVTGAAGAGAGLLTVIAGIAASILALAILPVALPSFILPALVIGATIGTAVATLLLVASLAQGILTKKKNDKTLDEAGAPRNNTPPVQDPKPEVNPQPQASAG